MHSSQQFRSRLKRSYDVARKQRFSKRVIVIPFIHPLHNITQRCKDQRLFEKRHRTMNRNTHVVDVIFQLVLPRKKRRTESTHDPGGSATSSRKKCRSKKKVEGNVASERLRTTHRCAVRSSVLSRPGTNASIRSSNTRTCTAPRNR